MPAYNFHSVWTALEVLVECKACNRRVALTKRDGLPIRQRNMTPIKDARLKCHCGCAEVRSYIPISQDQVDFFLAGDPVGTMKRAS